MQETPPDYFAERELSRLGYTERITEMAWALRIYRERGFDFPTETDFRDHLAQECIEFSEALAAHDLVRTEEEYGDVIMLTLDALRRNGLRTAVGWRSYKKALGLKVLPEDQGMYTSKFEIVAPMLLSNLKEGHLFHVEQTASDVILASTALLRTMGGDPARGIDHVNHKVLTRLLFIEEALKSEGKQWHEVSYEEVLFPLFLEAKAAEHAVRTEQTTR